MRIFDPHIHMTSRTTDDYERMAAAGVRALVEPAFWLGQPRTSVGSFLDYFDSLIGWEPFRASQFGIGHHCTIALNPKEANDPRCREVLDVLPRYLDKDGVVAVGEIGYDSMTPDEDEVFAAQLALASSTTCRRWCTRRTGTRPPAPAAPSTWSRVRASTRPGAGRPPQRGDRRAGRRLGLLDGLLHLPGHQDVAAADGGDPARSTGTDRDAGELGRRLGPLRPAADPGAPARRCSRPGSPRTTWTRCCGATRSSSTASPGRLDLEADAAGGDVRGQLDPARRV